MTLTINTTLQDRYLIKQVIAQGGMGAIYLAEDIPLGVNIAIKENLYSSQEASRQFKREATILAGLRHPNLPRVTDHFEVPNQGQYLVMDFIDGRDLKQIIKTEGILDVDRVLHIGITICDALTYLHGLQPPVVHRDIKPGNIKISPDGKIFLVDFGLAKASQPGIPTTTGAQAFTPGYAPPEQYGEGRTGPATDIYGLGATMYAALTANIPEDAMARALGSAELTPILQRNPNVPIWLARVLDKAMAVQMNDRFTSAVTFRQALEQRSANAETLVAAPVTTSSQFSSAVNQPNPSASAKRAMPARGGKRKRMWLWVAIPGGAALLLGLAVLILLLLGQFPFGQENEVTLTINPVSTDLPLVLSSATLTAPLVETPTPEPSVVPTLIDFTATMESPTVATPIGGASGEIAYASDQSGVAQIWVMNANGSGQQQITNIPDGACQVDWSPDGDMIIFTSPCRLQDDKFIGTSIFVSKADGSDLRIMDTTPGGDFDPAWSPLGDKIVFTSLRDRIPHIYIYDMVNQSITALTGPSSFDSHPTWSPDGSQIAFQSNRLGVMQVWILDLKTGIIIDYSPIESGDSMQPSWSSSGNFIAYSQGSNMPWAVIKKTGDRFSPEIRLETIRPVHHLSISPDNRWLALNSLQEGNNDIYIINTNGGSLTWLTNSPAWEVQPVWRPSKNP